MAISIIIPTYNEEKYLPKLLDSIKSQDYKDYEIIVADAKSTDKTVKIAKSYGAKVIKGGHPGVGRNCGAKVAKNDYLFFFDSDSILIGDDYLSNAIKEIEKRKLGIAISQALPISDKKIDHIMYFITNKYFILFENIVPQGGGYNGLLTTKKMHKKIGGFNEKLYMSEDVDYMQKIGKLSKFGVLRKSKLLISVRRFDKEGRFNLTMKYLKCAVMNTFGIKVKPEQIGGYDLRYDK